MGQIGILNVGAGDTKLTFDPRNPAECIRSGRIVRDMLRRGYALLVEVDDGKGGKIYTRATDFDEKTSEYIIADFDPIIATRVESQEATTSERHHEPPAAAQDVEGPEETDQEDNSRLIDAATAEPKKPGRGNRSIQPGRGRHKGIPAATTSGIAVSRSAGG